MFKRLRSSFLLSALGLMAFAMSGCNSDSGSGSATGPAAGSSFAGSSITFNPTVDFTTGNNLTYINVDGGPAFPAAAVATPGTYTYVPNASFTAGTLTLTVDGIAEPIVLEISNFKRNGTNITEFTARSGGQSYPVTVNGTLQAYTPPPSGGSGGAGQTSASDIPLSMRGQHVLEFSESASGSGITDGSSTTFTVGARSLKFNGKTLNNPFFYEGNENVWIFKDGNLWYAVASLNGAVHEINVNGVNYTPFYGQYAAAGSDNNGGQLTVGNNGGYAGGGSFSATVTDVVGPTTMPSGSHLSVQTLTAGQSVTFTFSNNGDLLSSSLSGAFNFSSGDAVAAVYTQQRLLDTPAVMDTITIYKNNEGMPTSIGIMSVRTGMRTTQVSYTLTAN